MSSYPLTGWHSSSKNPTTGTGYGLLLGEKNRDIIFPERSPKSVVLLLEKASRIEFEIEVKLRDSFWKDCPEFKAPQIGLWMLSLGIRLHWKRGVTPKFILQQISENRFRVLHAAPPNT